MGRISKAIKLKLQELRIDDIFKDGILKYKGLLSNEESEDNLERNIEENSDLDIQKDFEDNNVSKDNTNEVEEKQVEDNYEHDSIGKIESLKKLKQILENIKINETMMQYFEWYYPYDGSIWIKED